MTPPILEIAISTLGLNGLERIAATEHPAVEGVIYSVACQLPEGDMVIPKGLQRPDFKVRFYREKGLSRNRNRSLQAAIGEWILIADDDLSYSREDLINLSTALKQEHSTDIFLIRYHGSENHGKIYPEHRCCLSRMPKGYFVSSIEMLMRRTSVQERVWFNENFGLGSPHLLSGEEDIFIESCVRRGLMVEALPMYIGNHPHDTTSEKNLRNPVIYEAKGAVFRYKYRRWWWLRLPLSGLKETILGSARIPLHKFLRYTLRGAITYGAKAVKEEAEMPLLSME
jgi:glycosyltransferase involved in cell wall biosynthesis